MKVLHINSGDVVGSRFNGFDVRHLLVERGIDTHHLVWNRISEDPASSRIFDVPGSRAVNRAVGRLERNLAIHSRLQWQSFVTPLLKQFRNADVVHYHIIYDGYFSLDALPMLTRLKPSIWTWHDPWPMTGHCIWPIDCERWQDRCGSCPRLDLPFAMSRDRTAEQFAWKKRTLERSRLDIVVASDHMHKMAQLSPIGQKASIHKIPFGIDLMKFSDSDRVASRARLGILAGRTVIGLRAFADSPYKGFEYFVEAMRRLDDIGVPLTLLTTHDKGFLNEFIGRHQIIDLGWVNDQSVMMDTFRAADFFVMPSIADAFGMMAIEAMACSKPIIVFEGSALPEVTGAPEVGIAVPARDVAALEKAIRRLVLDVEERRVRGEAGRKLAEERYSDRLFADRLAALYHEVADR